MFNTVIDIKTIVGVIASLTVLSLTITAMVGFTIKKLFQIMKG